MGTTYDSSNSSNSSEDQNYVGTTISLIPVLLLNWSFLSSWDYIIELECFSCYDRRSLKRSMVADASISQSLVMAPAFSYQYFWPNVTETMMEMLDYLLDTCLKCLIFSSACIHLQSLRSCIWYNYDKTSISHKT